MRVLPARVWALIVKEFLAVWRDPKSRFVLVAPPLIQLALFAHAATFEVENAALAILNEDRSAESRELAARFTASDGFRAVETLTHVRQIRPTIDRKDAVAVLHIPPDFAGELKRAAATGRDGADVQLIVDGRRSNTALVLLNYAQTIVADYAGEVAAERGAPGPPATLVSRAWFNPNLDSQWFIVPGLVGTLTLVVVTVVASLSVARERELGTFEQLMVTPLRPHEILIGKTVPALLIGLAEGAFIAAVAVVWFQVPLRGSVVLLVLSLLVFLLSSIGVGLMISAYARTQQQAIVGSFLFLMPAVILSGFATPIENMPGFVQVLTYADPLRYALVILRGLFLRDLPPDLVLQQLWPMALIGAVTASVATYLFRKRLQ
ncbi:ABC-2 type transport system permease protein [Limimonas halophila]|uniref:ABC-2 type transport system permease protein n=1 Tax=Limimonas halophila TaxID=1082479 RepID=A0A1G7Q091_9PROT|nr:ABC transporter permease [Limimonas halophila]SDF91936.1 ABC-2 type transport system permease protein [Limimonas halophila]